MVMLYLNCQNILIHLDHINKSLMVLGISRGTFWHCFLQSIMTQITVLLLRNSVILTVILYGPSAFANPLMDMMILYQEQLYLKELQTRPKIVQIQCTECSCYGKLLDMESQLKGHVELKHICGAVVSTRPEVSIVYSRTRLTLPVAISTSLTKENTDGWRLSSQYKSP